ncbi:hypothetical protein DUNSADRAFT_2539 [Dunaliella salina]|uniref:Uncharacterized protein n=1 Tax=Dunaliella salina TaxID=3046 RepID=A0ABQ7FW68_DUNSA|nr:hypothetical protein DUNSADRAFT_2539 [Dunaliella salina]|eukprot:KAF5826618.1 hypothetical protein DUNSADRAFT_2539 [Dunaliella salina]
MDMKSLLSSFFGEYEGKALQKQGEVSKDQIIQFFNHGRQLFADQEFKLGLAMAHRHRRDVQRFVDQAQAKIWEQKVNPAVQGDYGITCLSRIRQRFQNDAEVLRMFYEFVHLEEKILDEAEMPGEVFKQKTSRKFSRPWLIRLLVAPTAGIKAAPAAHPQWQCQTFRPGPRHCLPPL